MKKSLIILSIISLFTVLFCGCMAPDKTSKTVDCDDIIRIHIRANSNSNEDQSVKLKVRDAVVCYLNSICTDLSTKSEAYELYEANLDVLSDIAREVLAQNGYDYGATAALLKEEFPTRKYAGITVEAGLYDSLIIGLGSAEGDNWWCIAFPPLCFDDTALGGEVVVRSRIAELIKNK